MLLLRQTCCDKNGFFAARKHATCMSLLPHTQQLSATMNLNHYLLLLNKVCIPEIQLSICYWTVSCLISHALSKKLWKSFITWKREAVRTPYVWHESRHYWYGLKHWYHVLQCVCRVLAGWSCRGVINVLSSMIVFLFVYSGAFHDGWFEWIQHGIPYHAQGWEQWEGIWLPTWWRSTPTS